MYIVTAKEMYDIDRYTMLEIGIDGKLLMVTAGREVCKKLETILTEKMSMLSRSFRMKKLQGMRSIRRILLAVKKVYPYFISV